MEIPNSEKLETQGYYLLNQVINNCLNFLNRNTTTNNAAYLTYGYSSTEITHEYFFPYVVITRNIPAFLYHPKHPSYICDVRSGYANKEVKEQFDRWAQSNRKRVVLNAAQILGFTFNKENELFYLDSEGFRII